MSPIRIVFMGTAEIACASLRELISRPEFSVVAIVTQPDKPSGRHLKPSPSAVKRLAQENNLQVFQPARAREESFIAELKNLSPDLIVVMAYGQILPETILSLPKHGCVNIHTSLLPKYRGAAPIQWAIANGETETGVTIMKMDAGMDTGPILSQRATPILREDNAQTLHDRLGKLGAELLVETLPAYVRGDIQPRAQPDGATYAPKITKEHGRLDWSESANTLWNRIRAFTPWPGAYTHLNHPPNKLLKVWKAGAIDAKGAGPGVVIAADKDGITVNCATGSLVIRELQLEGGRRMTAGEFLAGHPLVPGTKLG